MSSNIWKVTDNGSYKLTNGIIILVKEDIDSYKEGTLVFKDANSEIMKINRQKEITILYYIIKEDITI